MARPSWRKQRPRPPVVEAEVIRVEPLQPGLDIVEARLGRVQHELTAVSGGQSLCAISRSAGSVPAAKYLEGRLAALAALRRSVRSGQPLEAALGDLLREWKHDLEQDTARGVGPDWRAYRAGGVDELTELADEHAETGA